MGQEEVAIDTNVFEHLFNPQNNTQDHIDKLFAGLIAQRTVLCVDNKDRIFGEYNNRLTPLIKAMNDQAQKVSFLRYFLYLTTPKRVVLDPQDSLMKAIKGVIAFAEASDHVFVYVAIGSDSVLVSNDLNHITNHRAKLRKCAKDHGSKRTDFVNSTDAIPLMGI